MAPTDPNQIAPSFDEIQSRADYHLQEAQRILTAQYPWWAGKDRPDAYQRRAMRRGARRIRSVRRLLRAAFPPPPSTALERLDPPGPANQR